MHTLFSNHKAVSNEISHVSSVVDLQTRIQKIVLICFKLNMPRLTNKDRARALGMLECVKSQEFVTIQFNGSRMTITGLVYHVNTTGRLLDRTRPCQPHIASIRQENYVRQRHPCNRLLTAQETSSNVKDLLAQKPSKIA